MREFQSALKSTRVEVPRILC